MEHQKNLLFIKKYLEAKGLPLHMAVTFPDVFIVDEQSRVARRSDIKNISAHLSKAIRLNVPIVSANMADVSESQMAITLARLGGCGFVHQFLPIEKRAAEVRRVKRADNEVIEDPWRVDADDTFQSAWAFMRGKHISGVLVVDKYKGGKLAGILTARDVRFVFERFGDKVYAKNFLVKHVMKSMPLVTAPPTITTEKALELLDTHRIEKLPLVDKEGMPVGLITSKDIVKKFKFPDAARDKKGRLIVGATIGVSGDYLSEAAELVKAGVDVLLVDTARGNSVVAANAVRAVRAQFPAMTIVAGNVDNAEGTELLIRAGANCIKIGIGPGSACKTRTETGVGMPQLSAVAECAAVARKEGAYVMADGGIREGGDLAKAIVAGADTVMLGSLLAGTDESPGELYMDGVEKFKIYRGSAGLDTQLSRLGNNGFNRVRAPEGVTRKIPYKGQSAREVIEGLLENLRSSMSYTNATTIVEFQGKRFKLQSPAGYSEGQPKK